ncbi:hypothetical protein GCM10010912_23780 [Paenibacillus albidus]|uniref:Transposase InsH N-terminal domain-containing protein n=1 Tax=Paenibacillus albidus TaxID=2041023 RepID=A0A917FGQ2_9BACL|nr:hypothetical protein [Paenibacillus albidus]GGF78001.1 hypothetical protein GCM10010912_23780 [Paenibacillus albidus]
MVLEEDIQGHHLVRVVNSAVNRFDDATFDATYPGGGRDSYYPKMLTKVTIYALQPHMEMDVPSRTKRCISAKKAREFWKRHAAQVAKVAH